MLYRVSMSLENSRSTSFLKKKNSIHASETFFVIQTEAERRKREAEVVHWIVRKGIRTCLYVLCMYVCFFKHFETERTYRIENGTSMVVLVDNTLLSHAFRAVVIPAIAWHVIEVPIALTLLSEQCRHGRT